ncbi:glutamate 5-kinase [Liquorilactobacillus satsumensis]|uniref:Glutamate 5-kinase n=1 Tax=Liquorilactobacillus satsumensis DSM 16230 = JCM 12392 TaxID=1423801 RepID=A0A0R1UWX8_9LACO|nr:glutamate 5-kinase [Liquorilactobacillus satsumensis]KRL97769.1 glutamate 5-kinase [Liquorilactobacillus satsumensis DSM 16230 = JCM 12392]MCC7666169.1 glutamate 5-kinase [Liquorilactobacillus satsumensis]MCP9313388.1 glutamate 5-kinase [Liquorilactobacillus satsumensis]MCP9329150.1 glutamate 5-kinase [Liquorilactobacillus satsumensis]MCP9357436.1 glutamate 5-kinase [Liquorilactobacillus satsumensis]
MQQMDAKRIVIKVGTSTLTHDNGKLNLQAIDQLCYTLSGLVNEGKEIVLVSSGAIGVGLGLLRLHERPASIPEQQAVASVGQTQLMTVYQQRFSVYGQKIGQILLTHDVVDYPISRQNVLNTFENLLRLNIIPIVNENDAVAVDELDHHTRFGDNDQLSAIVARAIDADLLIMLSDIDGFYDKNPRKCDDAVLIERVTEISEETFKRAGGRGTKLGTGGMITKLKAAEIMLKAKKAMLLANGENPSIIFKLLDGTALGTLFKGTE